MKFNVKAARSQRFSQIWRENLLPGAVNDVAAVFQALDRLYGDVSRSYHSWEHIDYLLVIFDQVKHLADKPVALELAIWFHDAVFEPGNANNEQESAELFLTLSHAVMAKALRDSVVEGIMATRHNHAPEFFDGRLLADIDLLSFALPPDDFLKNSNKVRDEFRHVADEEYYPRQNSFLIQLLKRKQIFLTEFFQQRYESTARHNIGTYITALEKLGLTHTIDR